ncbi:unnamed protein product, partial [Oppiella nova]
TELVPKTSLTPILSPHMPSKYYAVRRGRAPGVYNSWDECKSQVDGYSGAQFKSFRTAAEAKEFVDTPVVSTGRGCPYGSSRRPNPLSKNRSDYRTINGINTAGSVGSIASDNSADSKDRFVIYTDGACTKNGRRGARGGIGAHFPARPDRDISEPLEGRQTNNRAEIWAAVRALEAAKAMGELRVDIKTDSKFMMQAVNEWSPKWRRNGWKTSTGADVINKEDFLELERVSQGMDVQWTKVRAHSGVAGNERADQLAVMGSKGVVTPQVTLPTVPIGLPTLPKVPVITIE